MNKTCKVEWFDDVDVDSWKLAAKEYGVSAEKTKDVDEDTVEIRVSGEYDHVKAFVEDMDSGDVRPMCGKRELGEDEYAEWLDCEISKIN